MITPVELLLGWRYTRAERRSGFLSFIAATAMFGVALAIVALITILSVMNGFEEELRDRLLGFSPHLTVRGEGAPLAGWEQREQQISAMIPTAKIAPVIEKEAMITLYDQVQGARLQGIDPNKDSRVDRLNTYTTGQGLGSLRPGDFSIVIGEGLARSMQIQVGDDVTVISSQPNRTPAGLLPRLRRFRVVGIFAAGVHEFDTAFAFVHIKDAAKLFRFDDKISSLQIRLENALDATLVKKQIIQGLPNTEPQLLAAVSDWTDDNENLFKALKTEKIVMSVVLALTIAVAAFNLLSTLAMLVAEKRSEIAILRTLGMSRFRIVKIFFIHGGIIGLVGISLGTFVGILLASHVSSVVAWLESALGFKVLSPDVYYISDIPSKLESFDVGIAVLVSMLLCLFAPLYPALSASRIEPAKALRYE